MWKGDWQNSSNIDIRIITSCSWLYSIFAAVPSPSGSALAISMQSVLATLWISMESQHSTQVLFRGSSQGWCPSLEGSAHTPVSFCSKGSPDGSVFNCYHSTSLLHALWPWCPISICFSLREWCKGWPLAPFLPSLHFISESLSLLNFLGHFAPGIKSGLSWVWLSLS